MGTRELELSELPQTSDPPIGPFSAILNRLTWPFRRGHVLEPQPATGFYTDTTVCIGCKACEVACKQWNQLAADGLDWTGNSYDNTAELSATSWRHVKFIEQFAASGRPSCHALDGPEATSQELTLDQLLNGGGAGRWLMMSDVCKHCVAAPCQHACPTGAIIYNEFANVYIQRDICNGCSYCIAACPFGVITRSDFDGHSHKCTLCYDRQRDGLVPACAKACPTESIQFGPIDELRDRARKRVDELHKRGVAGAYLYGDEPTETYSELHSFYLLVDSPATYGLPETPFNPWLHMLGDYGRTVASALVTIAAILAVLFSRGADLQGDDKIKTFDPGYIEQDVTKVPGWHGLVAWDLLFNNLTTGLFLFASVCELASPDLLGPVARAAYPVAFFCLLTDLMMLVLDLGDPLRFHHMLRVFKPSSPMSLGTWCLTVYSLPLTLIIAIEAAQALKLLPPGFSVWERVRLSAVVLGLLPAFGSLAYKGVLFSTSSQPGWKDARWLGGYMANSAILLGCAELLALSVLTGYARAAAVLRTVTAVLVCLNVIPAGLLFSELQKTLSRIFGDRKVYLVLAFVLAGGTLLPLFLLLVADGSPSILGASALILVGSLAIRFLFIKIPHASHESRSAGKA